MSQMDTTEHADVSRRGAGEGTSADPAHGSPNGHGCHRHAGRGDDGAADGGHARHGHGWMMMACCVPMLAIAVVLLATGVGFGAILPALACVGMMAMMMLGMSHGARRRQ